MHYLTIRSQALLIVAATLMLQGCGDDEDTPNLRPLANAQALQTREENAIQGRVEGSDPEGAALQFRMWSWPRRGRVQLNADGQFTYTPAVDYFGVETFTFVTSDGEQLSKPAVVSIEVANVNDPPTLEVLDDLTNSPDAFPVRRELRMQDADGDQLLIEVTSASEGVAGVEFDPATQTLSLEPRSLGTSLIDVRVADAEYSVNRSFTFEVQIQSRTNQVLDGSPGRGAIAIANTSDANVEFSLEHNGAPVFTSQESMIEFVRAMQDEMPGEPFQRKLWRFVRDNVYHGPPLNEETTHGHPQVVIESLGWGFCSNVASAYVTLARSAGYDARVWGLTGHVVPEILIDGRWQMYDPDLAVYYRSENGEVAAVEELVANPALITAPIEPVLSLDKAPVAYSDFIAQFYASLPDNYVADANFLSELALSESGLLIPGGGRLLYPGNWTGPPTGYDGDVVESFLQAKLELPPGWSGSLRSPWVLWGVRGEGTLLLGEDTFEVGTPRLADHLHSLRAAGQPVEVIASTGGLELIFMINALAYQMSPENAVTVQGIKIGALSIENVTLDLHDTVKVPADSSLRKPTG